jgi:hypothetical protein
MLIAPGGTVSAFCFRSFSFLVLSLFVFCITASAQYRASLTGTITDAAGGVVPNATVTLNSKETGRSQKVGTGGGGVYSFDRLAPGHYSLNVEAPGFKKKVLDDVQVIGEQTQGLNVQLEVGQVSETVTVSGQSAAMLETESASVDGTISNTQIKNLPTIGRDPFQLIRLTPGVFGLGAHNPSGNSVNFPNNSGPGGSSSGSSIFQTENQVAISANGQRVTANNYQIDGVNVNSQAWGGAAVVTPNPESVKEIRVVSSSYSAESGRNSGAQVEVVSQNGTNEFHGSAFLKIDDPVFNSYNRWGGPHGEKPLRDENRYKQWAGSLGGPIVRNHLFFFFSYETLRSNTNAVTNKWVETPEYVQLLQNARPGTLAAAITNTPGMLPNVSNTIPRDCASVNLGSTTCAQTSGGLDIGKPGGKVDQQVTGIGGGLDGIPDIRYVQQTNKTEITNQQYNGRIDYQLSQSDLLAFSMYYVPSDTRFPVDGRPIENWLSARRNIAGTLLWTRTISPTIVNEARFNVTRWYFNEITSNSQMPWGIPRDQVSGSPFPDLSINWGPGGPGVFYQTTYDFRDTLSKVWGTHVLKFGGEVSREQNNDTVAGGARPTYDFNNLWDFANDAPIDEAGNFDPRNGFPTDLKKYIRAGDYALFVQDDWKVKPNLTLNLGLRWEYLTPIHEKYGNISNPVLGNGTNPLLGVAMKLGGDLSNPDRNNFGPQFGFAWSPTSISGHELQNRLVLRGGFGIGFNRIPQSLTLNGRLNPPFFAAFTLRENDIRYSLGDSINSFYGWPSNPATILTFDPATNIPIMSAASAPPDLFGIPLDMRTPYTYRFSFETQYDLGHNWMMSLGYQGSATHKYPRVVNYSQFFPPNPSLKNVKFIRNDVNSNYNALLTRISHRFGTGFELNAQYRWAKSLDFCSNDDNCVQTYPFNQATEYGPSDFDVKHTFNASGVWSLPIFRNRHGWLGFFLGGWQISGIFTASTGFPWTPVYAPGNCDAANRMGVLCPQRPAAYLGGAGNSSSNSTFQQQGGNFPGDALSYFVAPANLTDYTPPGVGRNSFRGPKYLDVDAAAGKRFRLPKIPLLGENAGLEIRANFFNIFNTLNLSPFLFNSGSTQINSPDFGRATSALAGRTIEFQGRFDF